MRFMDLHYVSVRACTILRDETEPYSHGGYFVSKWLKSPVSIDTPKTAVLGQRTCLTLQFLEESSARKTDLMETIFARHSSCLYFGYLFSRKLRAWFRLGECFGWFGRRLFGYFWLWSHLAKAAWNTWHRIIWASRNFPWRQSPWIGNAIAEKTRSTNCGTGPSTRPWISRWQWPRLRPMWSGI